MLCMRKDLTYVHNVMPQRSDNEYVSVTVKMGHKSFTVVAAYFDPGEII